jgi:metal-responsive CopG/Arc/MetJ family transcriptional regulator
MRIASFKLPEELDQTLTAVARERHVSRSALVREAIENFVKPPRRSALDLAGDLVGSIDGPADLSTSPKHMKDFGE